MQKYLKYTISIIPILFIIFNLNLASADTYTYTYNDPSLKTPPGCSYPGGGNPCSDNGNRVILANLNYTAYWNHYPKNLSMNLTASYQICNQIGQCYDGNSPAVYGGNSKLVFNTSDLLNKLYLTNEANTEYYTTDCNSGACSNSDNRLKSNETLSWIMGIQGAVPTMPEQTKNYTAKSIFTPGISTQGYSTPMNLQLTTATDTVFLTFDAPELCPREHLATIACGDAYYFQLQSGPTQYKAEDIYNNKVISSYICSPNDTFGSPANVTVLFKQQTPCLPAPNLLLK